MKSYEIKKVHNCENKSEFVVDSDFPYGSGDFFFRGEI